jgi:hypothetical protein
VYRRCKALSAIIYEQAIIINTSLIFHTKFEKKTNIKDNIDSERTPVLPLPFVSRGDGKNKRRGRILSK